MEHEQMMRLALEEAQAAFDAGEVPVGCVIADKAGNILGRGHNRRENSQSALAHAEIEAIAEACRARGSWRLDDCTLYVTLEPCPMCAGAIIASRVPVVVFGAREENTGACGSVVDLFSERFGHRPAVYGGVLEAEGSALLREFFEKVRK
ncbi:MAG: nucleoside deaminase [Ruminococcaceae bacterium]|nr:nucleoside deaminase [Oscillospiraceae bacterium]